MGHCCGQRGCDDEAATQYLQAQIEQLIVEARLEEVNTLWTNHHKNWDVDECDIYKERIAQLKSTINRSEGK